MSTGTLIDLTGFSCLNIGGGNFSQREDGWLNLDFPFDAMASKRDFSNIDIEYNMMSGQPIPLPDECLRAVYSEHALEHVPFDHARFVMEEAFRILKPGGVFKVCVPDTEKLHQALMDEAFTVEEYPSGFRPKYGANSKEQVFLDATLTPLRGRVSDAAVRVAFAGKSLSDAMREFEALLRDIDLEVQAKKPGNHLSYWTADRLSSALEYAGFRDVVSPLGQRESRSKLLRKEFLDRTQHKWTLRAEGTK